MSDNNQQPVDTNATGCINATLIVLVIAIIGLLLIAPDISTLK